MVTEVGKYYLGVDLGSTTAKSVIVDERGAIVGSNVVQMGAVSKEGMRRSVEGALLAAGLVRDDISGTIGTGYGRRLVPGVDRTFTEITCHARGVAAMCPGVALVIDVGGQDSKVIAVDDEGLVDNFAMNDRCASGTGRFFEVLARAIEVDVDDLGALALRGTRDLEVSSMCATFAETELVSLLAEGAEPADIAASVHRAVAARTLGMVAQVGKRSPVVMTGGVAKNAAAVKFLADLLGTDVRVPADPQVTGAYGAALLALETYGANGSEPGSDVEFPVRAAPGCATCALVNGGSTSTPGAHDAGAHAAAATPLRLTIHSHR
ncbi:benzoyl-CoA reductase [Nakamurella sp. YIM 132087]|uniref:Benzoyl-CoA reductase n=1 Tax=Nakamurella alba TaxID=2665158 RepID=A0A7K1FEK1_9ACTN|nr:acyl-CoA dehydratase activase [Nakamurella alba]MTD12500.1 benzoyl-CoA reductase [Nakamurella alba]